MGKSLGKETKKIIFLLIMSLSLSFNLGSYKKICLPEYKIKQSWLERFLWSKVKDFKDNEILLLEFSTIASSEDLLKNFEFIDIAEEEMFIDTTTLNTIKNGSKNLCNDTTYYTNEKDKIKSVVLIQIEKDRLDWFSDKSGFIKLRNKIIVILGEQPERFLRYNGRDTCFNVPEKSIFIIYEPRQDYYIIKDTCLVYSFSI